MPAGAFPSTVISTHDTAPALVSKFILPVWNVAALVTPLEKSYVNPPFPISRPPANVEVAVVDVA